MNRSVCEIPCIYQNIIKKNPVTVTVPGSKSIANRALLLSALADGTSRLYHMPFSKDTCRFAACLQELGTGISTDRENGTVTVYGSKDFPKCQNVSLDVGDSGTAARFLTALLGLSESSCSVTGSLRMQQRPMADLLNCLKELGCEIIPEGKEGFLPVRLSGHGFLKNDICISVEKSSQFLSALLLVSPLSSDDFKIEATGKHGMNYVNMTLRMMEQFGVHVQTAGNRYFCIPAGQEYQPRSLVVEPDVSSAAYFYACVPLLNIPVLVKDVHFNSLQGDIGFIHILECMGCVSLEKEEGILLMPPEAGIFHGITADLSSCSDQAITLAAIAPFADSPTTLTGIGHIRYQESNRIRAIVTELQKAGISCTETENSITVYPGMPVPTTFDTYNDHRMAMGFSLIGLRSPGIRIREPSCCEKTFPGFFTAMERFIKEILYTKK